MSRKNHWKSLKEERSVFRGYTGNPNDALSIAQAESIVEALTQQRDFYVGELGMVQRQIPYANGNTPQLV